MAVRMSQTSASSSLPSTPVTQARRSRKRARLQAPSIGERPQKRRSQPEPSSQRARSDIAQDEIQEGPQNTAHELEDDDTLDEVVLTIDMRNRDTIGCSYYVAREEKLYILSDVKYGGLDIIDNCKISSS